MRGCQSPIDAPLRVASRLILRGDWYRPGESLWGAIQKLAFLNPLPPAAFGKLLLSNAGTRGTLGAVDLRCWGPIVAEKFATALCLNWLASDIALATLEPLSLSDVTPAPRFSQFGCGVRLRYCPICLVQGLHSTIHQLPYVVSCPWHNVAIMDRCKHGDPIPYELSQGSLRYPMCCRHGEMLWPGMTARRWGATMSDQQVEDVRALAQWIAQQRACVPPFELVSSETGASCGTPLGIDSAKSDIRLVPVLHGIVRGPAWLDIACPTVQLGYRITRRCHVEPLGADEDAIASASIHRIPTTKDFSGILPRRSKTPPMKPFRGFEAQFLGWVRRSCLQHLARFKARHLASHRCCATTGRYSFDRFGNRLVCLIGEAYGLCNEGIGISPDRPVDVREWFFFAARGLRLFAFQLAALRVIFARDELLRTISSSQRNTVLRWFAHAAAEVVVMRSLESSLTAVILGRLSRSPWDSAREQIDARYVFPGEVALTPIVLEIEGRPIAITMHTRTELSEENWQRVAACTQLCDLLSSPQPDPLGLCDLLESCGLAELRNVDGRTIREVQLAEWRRQPEADLQQ